MASTLTMTVPPDQGEAVLGTLLRRYQAEVAALHVAIRAYLDDRQSPAQVLEHRDELVEIERLLDLVGWRFGPRSAPVELVGPPGLVRAVVYGTLVAAAKAFADDVERYERAEIELERLRATSEAVAEHVKAFLRVEAATG